MCYSIKKFLLVAAVLAIVSGGGFSEARAGGGIGWGWAKPLNKRLGAFYTSNRNANFGRRTSTRTTYSAKTYRQPVYQTRVNPTTVYHPPVNPTTVYHPPVKQAIVSQRPVIVAQSAAVTVEPAGTLSHSSPAAAPQPTSEMSANELLANSVLEKEMRSSDAVVPNSSAMTTQMAIERWQGQ